MTHGAEPDTLSASPAVMPASQQVMIRALKWAGILTLVLAIGAGLIGYLVVGVPGLTAGLLGAVFAGAFLGLTAASIAFANRFIAHPSYLGIFAGLVMGSWVLKFIVFLVVAFLLRDAEWLNPRTFFVTVIIGVVLSLALDVWIMLTSRVPTLTELVAEGKLGESSSSGFGGAGQDPAPAPQRDSE